MQSDPANTDKAEGGIEDIVQELLKFGSLLHLRGLTPYERLHDAHNGTGEGVLSIMFTPDEEVHLLIRASHPNAKICFKTSQNGGLSPRTRDALLILAEAIRLDNEHNPQ